MLQRRLKLGYARAARIVDQYGQLKIVGPFEGAKPRQLLINRVALGTKLDLSRGRRPSARRATARPAPQTMKKYPMKGGPARTGNDR
jgi:hypothetical protein